MRNEIPDVEITMHVEPPTKEGQDD
jgi:hypothetical protein